MYHYASTIARQARFDNCTVLQIHKGYNLKVQTIWELYIATDETQGGFKEAVFPTLREAKESAADIESMSNGFIKKIIVYR